MRIAIPVAGDRISPVLDVARRFLLVDLVGGEELERREVAIEEPGAPARARRLARHGCELLICGAASWPLESLLRAAGIRVVPNRCGPVDELLAALRSGGLPDGAFLMPGCHGPGGGRRARRRRGRGGRRG